jgi:hypothetical protein
MSQDQQSDAERGRDECHPDRNDTETKYTDCRERHSAAVVVPYLKQAGEHQAADYNGDGAPNNPTGRRKRIGSKAKTMPITSAARLSVLSVIRTVLSFLAA